jgi:hypothetical protein
MKHLHTFESFLNEANYKPEDFPVDSIVHFKDGEEWIVVKSGMRGSGNFKQSDEITMKPHNKLAKDRNVSMSSDFRMVFLNKEATKIEKP